MSGRRLDRRGDGRPVPSPALLQRIAPEEPPAWAATPSRTADEYRAAFDREHDELTVGIEEEVMLLDPASVELAPAVEEALVLVNGDERFKRELRQAQLEIVTPPAPDGPAAGEALARARRDLAARLEPGLAFASAGTHPFSSAWGDVVEGPRYREIAKEYAWAAQQALPCGMHVHVAVAGAGRALAAYNALRSYLPELAALAANAPFLDGADSGLASVRPMLIQGMLRVGIPPVFPTWEAFAELAAWGRRGGLYPDASHFWWQLRPHVQHGTLELRVFDAQTRAQDALAIAALCQALVADLLGRIDAGERLPVHPTHRIAENDWRATRYGVRGFLVDLETGARVSTRERLATLIDSLAPTAERLGIADALHAAATLVADAGADRQRYVAEREGLTGLVEWLARETRDSAVELAGESASV